MSDKTFWAPQDEIACLQQQVEQLKKQRNGAFQDGFTAGATTGTEAVVKGACKVLRTTTAAWDGIPPDLIIGYADLMEKQMPIIIAAICAEARRHGQRAAEGAAK